MKNNDKRIITVIADVLLIVIWVAVMVVFCDFRLIGFFGWFAFLFVPVSIILSTLFLFLHGDVKNDSGTLGIPFYYSGIFLIISFIVNGIFLLLDSMPMRPFVIVFDIVILAIYLILMLVTVSHTDNVKTHIQESEESTWTSSVLSRELGTALSFVNDADIRSMILSLKEKVDYSGNSGRTSFDQEVINAAVELRQSVSVGNDKSIVESIIKKLEDLLAARSAGI